MTDLTAQQIERLIEADAMSDKKRYARIGQKYYEGEHDILNYRVFYYNADGELVEDRYRSNERISHPFFTELVDQFTAYLLSDDEDKIITSDVEGLQDFLDGYFNETFYSELSDCVSGAYTKGFDYLYAYKGNDDRLIFQCADSLGVIEVREKDTDSKCQCTIYTYVDRIEYGKKVIKRIQVHYPDKIAYFVQKDNGKIIPDEEIVPNPCPNIVYLTDDGQRYGGSLGFIPFWRLDYNRKQISGLKPIKSLIDDYDLMECGLSNNLQDFDNPIYVVKGFRGDNLNELSVNIRTKKMIGVNDTGDFDIKTIDIPYEARKTKADEDEKNIYRFGMGINMQGLKDTTATTNLIIQTAYTLLDLKSKKFAKNLKKFLRQIINVVINEINQEHGTGFNADDVVIRFHPNILFNETENANNEKTKAEIKQIEINTILNVSAMIGDEEALKAICNILDIDFDEIKDILNSDDYEDVQTTLNNIEAEEGAE